MKWIRKLIFILILGLIINPFFLTVKASETINVHFFHSDLCLVCRSMETYLEELEAIYPEINVIEHEVYEEKELFLEVVDLFSLEAETPTVVIEGIAIQGYSEEKKQDVVDAIEYYLETSSSTDIVQKVIDGDTILDSDFDYLADDTIILPIIGEVNIGSVSVLLSAILLGLFDGFNPCALWVLIFLITLLINHKDRKRMWIIGFTFIFTSALMYFMIMFVFTSLITTLTHTVIWFRYLVSLFAILFGSYNIYKYFKNRKKDIGCTVTDENSRSKLMDRIRGIVNKRNIFIALGGTILLAISVNLIELACSTGYPALFVSILSVNNITLGASIFYLVIYIIMFLLDDIIIFSIAMFTMNVTAISNKYTNLTNIIGGIVMLGIGLLLGLNII